MNIQPAPSRTPALETDNSGVFNRIWVRWFDTLKSVIEGLRTNVNALPTGVADTSSIDLSVSSNIISGVVLPAGVDHAQLANPNSANYTHLTAVQATDLTDGGATTLHSHANDHARQHSIISTSDHTSSATSGKILKADANGLPVDATNTDTDVASAVTLKHVAATVADTSTVDMSISGQQINAETIGFTGEINFIDYNYNRNLITVLKGLIQSWTTTAIDKGFVYQSSTGDFVYQTSTKNFIYVG